MFGTEEDIVRHRGTVVSAPRKQPFGTEELSYW
jgi:hypothetical protein